MTTEQSFKIAEILEEAIPRDKAQDFTKLIDEVLDGTLKSGIESMDKKLDKLDSRLDKIDTRLWAMFITLGLMILGLYGTLFLRK